LHDYEVYLVYSCSVINRKLSATAELVDADDFLQMFDLEAPEEEAAKPLHDYEADAV
jgi:hypothetical protein